MAVFGKTTVGTKRWSPYSMRLLACRFELAEYGEVSRISVYIDSREGRAKCAIYDDLDGEPNKLLGVTEELLLPHAVTQWYDFNFPTSLPLTAGFYHLVVWTEVGCYFFSGSGWINQSQYRYYAYNGFPDPFHIPPPGVEAPTTYLDEAQSICATYTPAPAPTHTLSVNSTPISGVPFTVTRGEAMAEYTTPWSGTLEEGTYGVTMPPNILVGTDTYNFKQWEDLSTSPIRTINLLSDIAISAGYELVIPPPGKGYLQVHAFFNTGEVAASGRIIETGQTFTTPATLQVDPATYTIELTYLGVTKTYPATVAEGQTLRVDAQFAMPTPIPPIQAVANILSPFAIGIIMLALSRRR